MYLTSDSPMVPAQAAVRLLLLHPCIINLTWEKRSLWEFVKKPVLPQYKLSLLPLFRVIPT